MADRVTRAVKPEPEKQTTNRAAKAAPRFIDEAPGGSVVVDLKYPLEWDGQEYRQVELRRLKGKDFSRMRRLAQTGIGEDEAMLTIITGIPVEVIQELDGDDFLGLIEAAKDFIPARFRETAESGLPSETGPNMPE